jgi:transposase
MGKPLSMDLRRRALAAVDTGMSRRAAAGRFGVSVSSVIRWHAEVMAAFEEERDQSLEELRAHLAERGIAASTSALSRFFQRHGMTRKKDWTRGRAGPCGCAGEAPRLVRDSARSRP